MVAPVRLPLKGFVEAEKDEPGGIRLAEIKDFSATSLHGLLADNTLSTRRFLS